MFISVVGVVSSDITGRRFSENPEFKLVNSFVHCMVCGVYFVFSILMNITVVWDVMPCNPVDGYQPFGGTCCL